MKIFAFVLFGSLIGHVAAVAHVPVDPWKACNIIRAMGSSGLGPDCHRLVIGSVVFSPSAAGACISFAEKSGDQFYAKKCMEQIPNAYFEDHGVKICSAVSDKYYGAECMSKVANKTMDPDAAKLCFEKAKSGESGTVISKCIDKIAKDYDPNLIYHPDCLTKEERLIHLNHANLISGFSSEYGAPTGTVLLILIRGTEACK